MANWKKILIGFLAFLFIFQTNMLNVLAAGVPAKPSSPSKPNPTVLSEIKEERTQYSKTYLKSDGTKELRSYVQPIHYSSTANGKTIWNDIDSGLTKTPSASLKTQSIGASSTAPAATYTNKANQFKASFSSNLTQGGAQISQNNASVGILPKTLLVNGSLTSPYTSTPKSSPSSLTKSLSSASLPYVQPSIYAKSLIATSPLAVNLTSVTPLIQDNKLIYQNIAADTDLIYYSIADGIKEDIILNRYYGQNTFKFDVNISNATFAKKSDGSYEFYDKTTKKLIFYIPKLFMWDSKGGKANIENEYSFNITSQLKPKSTGGYEMTFTADDAWLKNPARIYPVTIDPSINNGVPYGLDTYVQEGYPNYNMWVNRDLYVGRGQTKKRTRTFIPFNIDLSNKIINSATLSVYQISCTGACAYSDTAAYVSGNYDPQGVTWNNQPAALARITNTNNNNINTWFNFDVTNGFKHWFEAHNPTGSRVSSFEFVQENEGTYGYRQWVAENNPDGWAQDKKPHVTVNYSDYNASYSFSGIHDAKVRDNYSASLNLWNTGADSYWSQSNTAVYLAIVNRSTGSVLGGLHLSLPYDMGNGAGATIPFNFYLNESPGNYVLYADVYKTNFVCSQGGVCYLADLGVPEGQASFNVTDYPDYSADISPRYPASYVAGSSAPLTVDLHNTGRQTWTTAGYSLGYRLIDAETNLDVAHYTTPLTRDVSPIWTGDAAYLTMQLNLRVPLKTGAYTLKVDLLQSGTGWFSDRGISMPSKSITVTAPSFASITHLGVEDRYAMIGPVDATTGGLIYSVGDASLPTVTGGINLGRNYNSNISDTSFTSDSNGFITKWLLNGPYYETDFTTRFEKSYINETSLKPSPGLISNNHLWFEANAASGQNTLDINSIYDNLAAINKTDNLSTYANVYVYSPSDQNLKFKIGSDDGQKVWLNGNLISCNNVSRSPIVDNDVIPLTLKTGWNRLLVKVTQGVGGHSLVARFTDTQDVAVTNLKFTLSNPDIIQTSSVFGKNWSPNFIERLDVSDGDTVYYLDGTNSLNIYTKNSDGTYQKPAGSDLTLIKNNDGTYSMADQYGTKYNYRADGRISNRVDQLGNTLNYQYDSLGNCTKIYDKTAAGTGTRALNIVYTNGLVSSVTAQNNATLVKYSYTNGLLTKVTDPLGNSVNYVYDATGKMTENINKNGQKIVITYTDGKVTNLQDPLGNNTKFSYSTNKVEVTDPLNRKSTIEYDPVGKMMTQFTDATKYSEKYEYDAAYNVTRVYPMIPENDGLFYSFDYAYDQNNNLISSTDPLGNKTTVDYENNLPVKQTDASGNTVKATYNSKGLATTTADAKGNTTSYTYDASGHLLTTTDPNGNKTTNVYNLEGDLTSTISPKGETASFAFDTLGKKLTQTSPLGSITKFNYDANGRLTSISDATGLTTKVEYDANGNIIKQTNPKGFSKVYTYDNADNLISITDEVGAKISYEYDSAGNQTKMIDANGKVVSYEYDSLNQLTKITDARGKTSTVVYDKNGNVTNSADFNGNQFSQKTDKAGDPIEITSPDGTYTLKYDNNGNLTEAATDTQKATIGYDKNNNSTSVNSTTTGNVNAEYDKNNNLSQIKTDSTTVNLTYDANNKISQISQTLTATNQTLVSKITTDAEGKISSIAKANGETAQYAYDKSGRIITLTNRNSAKALISRYNYQYDSASNVTAISEDRTRVLNTYAYDGRNQLVKDNAVTYSYDPMGNRTQMVNGTDTVNYTYDLTASNELTKVVSSQHGATSYEYDNNGNIIKKTDSTGSTQYFYDSDGYFTKAILPDGTIVEYTYDKIAKLRTSRTQTNPNGTIDVTKFVWDSDRLVAETDAAGKTLKAYAWDENERLISVSLPDASGTMKTFYYTKNAKGDITSLTDQNGIRVADYVYDAWGNIKKSTTLSTSPIANIDKINPRLYSGYWYDPTLGTYFMKTRLYDPATGRFLSRDPLQGGIDPVDYNPYVYCGNNPINRIDPSGKFWNIIAGAVIGAVVGGAIDAVVQYSTKGSVNWKEVGVAALGGAVTGAVFAATFGGATALLGSSQFLGTIAASAISCAAGSLVSYTASNWGHLSVKGAAKTAGTGFLVGAVSAAICYGVGTVLTKVVSIAATTTVTTTVDESVAPIASKAVSAPFRNAPAPQQATSDLWAGGEKNLTNHLIKHGGGRSAEAYTDSALKVVANAERSGLQSNGRTLYNSGDLFTVTQSDGKIVSHYGFDPTGKSAIKLNASTPLDYFNKRINLK